MSFRAVVMKEAQGPFGGSGGHMFTDEIHAHHGDITRITVKTGQICDGIQVWYGDREAPFQGGSGGNKREAKLQGNERIIAVSGYCDDTYIRQLTIKTTRKTYGPWGKLTHQNGGRPFEATGYRLKYISGYAVPKVQGLIFHFEEEPRTEMKLGL